MPALSPVAPEKAVPEKDAPEKNDEPSPLEEAARKQFGLRSWDRPTLYRETAEAATDTDLPFWIVLLLSGAIATLGLVLNSTAVVIGAMLVAPLLGPLLGLSLSLAVGDGQLFVQTAATIVLGALGIIVLAALLTVVLPFQTVTDEIASRTRPTTLDLGIAVFSGLAGAVVTASRERRLSASIPGVAVAVALVPPLGVAGFGVGTGWEWPIIRGALLLFGANLAGIVLSGMLVFLLVGMQRADVVKVAREWHEMGKATGLAARIEALPALDRMKVVSTPWLRVVLVVAFMAAVSVPLSSSLRQIVRETRVASAVDATMADLEGDGRAFVIDRDISYGDGRSAVRLRIATTAWFSSAEEDSLALEASMVAGEPVSLALEQVLASAGDLDAFTAALPTAPPVRTEPQNPEPTPLPATLSAVRGRLATALDGLALPDSVQVLTGSIRVASGGGGPPTVEVTYAAPRRLPPEAEAILARQAAQALGLDPSAGQTSAVVTGPRAVSDSAGTARLGALLRRYPRLRLTLSGDSAAVAAARRRLQAPSGQLAVRPGSGPPRARLSVARDST